jgi:hypothetical protein
MMIEISKYCIPKAQGRGVFAHLDFLNTVSSDNCTTKRAGCYYK